MKKLNNNKGGLSMTQNNTKLKLKPLKLAMMAAALGVSGTSMSAEIFNNGDYSFNIDTTVSYGASWRVADRDNRLIGKSNLNPLVSLDLAAGAPSTLAQRIAAPGRWSINSDSGNLNYDQGDLFSNALKFTSDLAFAGPTWGAFMRVTGFYDFENADNDNLSRTAKEFVGEDYRLLDAYVYKDFDIGNQFASVRLGRQVVSWGESTFIQQGINVINPVDVSKIRVAGAELKEAFLPIDMLSFSTSITDNLSMEAVYMFEFEQIDPDPAGTYFGTNDFATPGAEYVALGFGIIPELTAINNFLNAPGLEALASNIARFNVPRSYRAGADDDGQFGVAFRYYAEALNNTEFGLYYLNYHSRLPLISGTSVGNPNAEMADILQGLDLPDYLTNPDSDLYAFGRTSPNSATYFVEYPEDIDLYGLSFNTTINSLGMSLQGELSYRPNVPLQIDDVEVLFAALSPLNAAIPAEYDRFTSQLGQFGPNEYVRGWERHEVSQLQFTATKLFGPNDFLGTDQVVLLGEIGFTQVWDLPAQDVLRYQGPGTDTGGGQSTLTGGTSRNPVTQNTGFPTDFSWGYRLVTRLDYNSVFGTSWNLSPRIAFNHDVNGTTPGPGGNFIEGRKSYTIGVNGIYLEKWSADISYTGYSGAGIHNLISDRDFVAFNVKYSF
ncbi:DUF1302 domain-containing protein [Marinicella sp. S1101]|uniref:DUF1302 domain-containing protein n=1 Tax=Marinicella marina TaxID=2996016 RepID=UPI0022610016|nr:DUF1302 domain-containing protein [Marinicella marina]MCX7554782.1 DUF1302 domain-containing protein [Marinicella marina]MDJ1140985.1 DUF1302 domain-containing protein [Marinicella marina]